jgi:hypothetical protein
VAEVSITFKAHGGYDAPWVVVRGLDGDEGMAGNPMSAAESVSAVIDELRQLGAFSAVKLIAQEFANAPAAGAESVQAVIPGAQEVPDQSGAAPSQAPPSQSTPPCEKCGAATIFKSGTSDKGPWSAYKCSTGDKDHTKWMKG